jgi:hypothetical protein
VPNFKRDLRQGYGAADLQNRAAAQSDTEAALATQQAKRELFRRIGRKIAGAGRRCPATRAVEMPGRGSRGKLLRSFPPLPPPLEIAARLPHSHSSDDETYTYPTENRKETSGHSTPILQAHSSVRIWPGSRALAPTTPTSRPSTPTGTPDHVLRLSDGEWKRACPRNYTLKPAKAVEFAEYYARRIKEKYGVKMSYTGVHSAVAPWDNCDYDTRVPGAGTLAATFNAYA